MLSPADRGLLRQRLAGLTRLLGPCPSQRQAALLAGMAAVMPTRASGDAEWRLRAAIYREDTAEYPADILEAAIIKIRRTQTFLPSIAELRAACDALLRPRTTEIQRLDDLLGNGAKALAAPDGEAHISQGERASRVVQLRELIKKINTPRTECPIA